MGKSWCSGSGAGLTTGFLWGVMVSTFLVSIVYLQFNSKITGSDLNIWRGRSGISLRGLSFDTNGTSLLQRFFKGKENNTNCYVGEWLSLRLREQTESERFGEKEFGEIHRPFIPMGISSFLFVHFGSYRVGPATFAIVGLGAKPMHLAWDSHSRFECSWVSNAPLNSSSPFFQGLNDTDAAGGSNATKTTYVVDGKVIVNGTAVRYTVPELWFQNDREYAALVVYCDFEAPVGVDGAGGKLEVVAEQGESRKHTKLSDVRFVAVDEQPGECNASALEEPLPYEYLYCSGPLFGEINPQRVREWMAYHMRLFGDSSYFILYDVGGLKEKHWEVLQPWVRLGRVSIINVREQARYSAHYFNQFMFNNDCLLKGKRLARWVFYFDMDEYMHVTDAPELEQSFHSLMDEMLQRGRKATSLQFLQLPMLNDFCLGTDNPVPTSSNQSEWAIEKLFFRRMPPAKWPEGSFTHWQDPKSAFQTKYVLAMGVHRAAHVDVPEEMAEWNTKTVMDEEECEICVGNKMHYYHYRGAASANGDLCQHFVDPANTTFEYDSALYTFDDTMLPMANIVKTFELNKIGPM